MAHTPANLEDNQGLHRAGASAPAITVCLLLLATSLASGCSVKKFAINKVGDSLANSGTTFASDDDLELIGQALPFGLKLMESLLAESPKHRGLLFATSSGFTQYAYAYVQIPAEQIEQEAPAQAAAQRLRAKRLYMRARDYGLRGLEVKHKRITQELRRDPKRAVGVVNRHDVPLLYWTAVSWGAAIAVSKDDPELVADQPVAEALIDRALALDPDYDQGAIHQFLITYEAARQGAGKDAAARSRAHFARAVELTHGGQAAPYVALAETVSVSTQDRAEFESLLRQALAVKDSDHPEWRLLNTVMKRRAHWLLDHADYWFAQ